MATLEVAVSSLIVQAKTDRTVMDRLLRRVEKVLRKIVWDYKRRVNPRGATHDDLYTSALDATADAVRWYTGKIPFCSFMYTCVRRRLRKYHPPGGRPGGRWAPPPAASLSDVGDVPDRRPAASVTREDMALDCTRAQVREILGKMDPGLAQALKVVYGIGVERKGLAGAATEAGTPKTTYSRRVEKAKAAFQEMWVEG